jgi:hypothetical protein
MTANDASAAVQRYLETLQRSYEVLTDASNRASARGVTVGRRFLDDVATGHAEAAELARRIDGKPEQAAMAQASIMAATLAAQARALTFTQLLADESSAAQEESQELVEQISSAMRECSEAGAALMQAWTSMSPFAEMIQRSMAAWTKPN